MAAGSYHGASRGRTPAAREGKICSYKSGLGPCHDPRIRLCNMKFLATSLLFLFGCAASVSARAPTAATESRPATSNAVSAPSASSEATLPFRMPCASDEVDVCRKGCEENQTEDCVTLGSIYLIGSAVPRDNARAVDLFKKACEVGSARGCLRMGDVVHAGLVTNEREIEYYERACGGGANLGCIAAAQAYLDGRGADVDPERAASLFDKSCAKGNSSGCLELAKLYDAGEGVPKDPDRARGLREKGCELGSDEACMATGSSSITPPR